MNSSSSSSVVATPTGGIPTIPIKQVTLNKKFVPLVVGCSIADIKTQAKLFDVRHMCPTSLQLKSTFH